jgi:hypothetical protein
MEYEKEKIREEGNVNERDSERFDPVTPIFGYFELTNEVMGEFLNREEFLIKNVSPGGISIVSNYPPAIGNIYPVFIHYGGEKHAFSLRIVHSRILRFQIQPEGIFRVGVVYASGCQILFEDDSQMQLILGIIQNDCSIPTQARVAL